MTDKLVMYFSDNSFEILSQPDKYLMRRLQCTPEYAVGVCSCPAFYACSKRFEIYLRGEDEDEDETTVYFDSKHLPHIIQAISIFCERVGWNFEHNLQERTEI